MTGLVPSVWLDRVPHRPIASIPTTVGSSWATGARPRGHGCKTRCQRALPNPTLTRTTHTRLAGPTMRCATSLILLAASLNTAFGLVTITKPQARSLHARQPCPPLLRRAQPNPGDTDAPPAAITPAGTSTLQSTVLKLAASGAVLESLVQHAARAAPPRPAQSHVLVSALSHELCRPNAGREWANSPRPPAARPKTTHPRCRE